MVFIRDKLQDATLQLEYPNFVNPARKTTNYAALLWGKKKSLRIIADHKLGMSQQGHAVAKMTRTTVRRINRSTACKL